MTIAIVSGAVMSAKQMPASHCVSAFLYFLLWKSSSLDVFEQEEWDWGSWLVDTWRERVPRSWECMGGSTFGTCKLEHLRCPWLTMESLWWNCSRNKWRPRILGESGSCFGRAWHFYSWWFTVGISGEKFFPSSPTFLQRKAQLYSRKLPNQLLYLVFDALHCSFTTFFLFCVEYNKINITCIFFPLSALSFESVCIFRKTTE